MFFRGVGRKSWQLVHVNREQGFLFESIELDQSCGFSGLVFIDIAFGWVFGFSQGTGIIFFSALDTCVGLEKFGEVLDVGL